MHNVLMFGGSGDAWRGYWCVGTPSVPCRAAAGKQCLSVGMHIHEYSENNYFQWPCTVIAP